MNIGCEDLYYADERKIEGAEFYVKELMMGYIALKDKVDKSIVKKWEKCLRDYIPEKNYTQVLSKCSPDKIYNYCTFALSGEQFKKAYGISNNDDFIEKVIFVCFGEKAFNIYKETFKRLFVS